MTVRAPLVEECFILSLHRVIRAHRNGRMDAPALALTLEPERAVLRVSIGASVQAIPLEHAPHNIAGTRWWLLCECGRRVFTLYRPLRKSHYRCRPCHGLRYRSENLSRAGRLEHRAAKLAKRLGGSLLRRAMRPKGMWHSTFLRRRERAELSNLTALWLRLSRAA